MLRNQRGLLFTSQTLEEVTKYFEEHSEIDYLRTGGIAEETVELDAGPLEQFSHAIEPQLRQLGMPTELKKGVINLMQVIPRKKNGSYLVTMYLCTIECVTKVIVQLFSQWQIDGLLRCMAPKTFSEPSFIIKTFKSV